MGPAALGLRAIPSAAPEAAFPWPRPQSPDAMAIPIPAASGLAQSFALPVVAAPGAWAKTSVLAISNSTSSIIILFMCCLLRNRLQEVVPGKLGSRRAHTDRRH